MKAIARLMIFALALSMAVRRWRPSRSGSDRRPTQRVVARLRHSVDVGEGRLAHRKPHPARIEQARAFGAADRRDRHLPRIYRQRGVLLQPGQRSGLEVGRRGLSRAQDLDATNKLVWLQPAPANNTWAIAVRADVAKEQNLATLDDFGRWIAGGGKMKIAASSEFTESAGALPAFEKAYGFKISSDQVLVLSGGDTAATEQAAASGTSGVNAAMAYGTDGQLAALGLVVMRDTKNVQLVFEPAPLIRKEVLDAHPEIAGLLAPVFKSLTLETLQQLNARIAVDGEDARSVAKSYLTEKGFLQ